MSEELLTNRREFLVSATLAAAATGFGCWWPFETGRVDAIVRLAGLLDDSDDVRRLGTEYLNRHPEEAGLDALVHPPGD